MSNNNQVEVKNKKKKSRDDCTEQCTEERALERIAEINDERIDEINDERIDITFKNINDLILDLKIISKLKPSDKLSIINNKITIDSSYLSGFYRFWSNDSREKTIKYLYDIDINLTIEIGKLIESMNNYDSNLNFFIDDPSNILINLSHDLCLSLTGINNLKLTYVNDDYIKSKFEILINNITLKIKKIARLLHVNKTVNMN